MQVSNAAHLDFGKKNTKQNKQIKTKQKAALL